MHSVGNPIPSEKETRLIDSFAEGESNTVDVWFRAFICGCGKGILHHKSVNTGIWCFWIIDSESTLFLSAQKHVNQPYHNLLGFKNNLIFHCHEFCETRLPLEGI